MMRFLSKKKKISFLFPVISVAVGVISVVVISTIGEIGKKAVKSEIDSLGFGSLTISLNEKSAENLLTQNELERLKALNVVSTASPIVYRYTELKSSFENKNCLLWGVDDSSNEIMKLPIIYGRGITNEDIIKQNDVCLIDTQYAKKTYGRENALGKELEILMAEGNRKFTVVGVVDGSKSLVKNFVSDFIPCFVYLPYSVMRLPTGDDFFSSIAVSVNPEVQFKTAEKVINTVLSNDVGFDGIYRIDNMLSHSNTIEKILSIVTMALSCVAFVSLFISGISVMTVMMYSVGERTREIGIKKAIGAGFLDILFEFLLEAFLISLIGCAVGVILGMAISYVFCLIIDFKASFDINMIYLCVAITSTFGLLFGIYPAIRAARLDPAEALRRL